MLGRTNINIQNLEKKIEDLETQLQSAYSIELEADLLIANEELDLLLQREHTRLSQQAKLSWIENEEASVQFFKSHATKAKPIVQEMLLSDGIVLDNPKAIHLGVVEYFSSFLKAKPPRESPDISLYDDESILEQENYELLNLPSI